MLERLRALKLNLDEVVKTKAAEVISNLRKHHTVEIANAAKQLRLHWKEVSRNEIL